MKIGVITGSFRDRRIKEFQQLSWIDSILKQKMWKSWVTLEEFLETAQQLGLQGVDIEDKYFPKTTSAYLTSLKKKANSLGIEIFGVSPHGLFFPKRPATASERIKYMKRWIGIAKKLGAQHVRASFGPDAYEMKLFDLGKTLNIKLPKMTFEDSFETTKKIIKKCLSDAKKAGVYMVDEAGIDAIPMVKMIDSEYYRICIDFTHSSQSVSFGWPESKYIAIQLLAPFIGYVHAKSHAFNAAGEEIGSKWSDPYGTDYKRAFSIIKNSGYDGVIVAEYEGEGNSYEECLEGTKKTVELLRKVW